MLKTEGQKILTEHLAVKSYKNEIKILAFLGKLNQALNNPARPRS